MAAPGAGLWHNYDSWGRVKTTSPRQTFVQTHCCPPLLPPKKQPRCAAFKLISKSALQTWVLPKIWGFAVSKFHSKNNQPVDEQSLRDLQLVTKTQFLQSNSRKISQHTNRVFGNSITGWQPKKRHMNTHEHKLNEQWAPMNSHELLWTSKPMQLINTFCSVGFACLDVKYVLIGRVSLPKSVCWFRWVREGTCGAWFWGIERHARRSNKKNKV